ncbi:ATP-binding protein [Streptomyces sp. ME19-01-6]|uniref:ATP-binding protein n=1 Tax=Streptomyces sp. ME19-01-6 TaxID=3028686 RepID=UPI0029AFF6C2|nr:ATP-binding protein [Streptomyces sp. ME19-01-6]MDX3227209.1 ATP-binding protein [Streptomyces sp. ME19-01-6]
MPMRRTLLALPVDPAVIASARDRVLTEAVGWGVPLDDAQREAVKLVVSELVTNAVVHGRGLVTVGLFYESYERRLLLVVYDGNPDPPKRRDAKADEEHGRGLALVDHLASRHGWEPTEAGKKVWAEFDVRIRRTAKGRDLLLRRHLSALTPQQYIHGLQAQMASAGGL